MQLKVTLERVSLSNFLKDVDSTYATPDESTTLPYFQLSTLEKSSKGLNAGPSCVWSWMMQAERECHTHFRSSLEGAQSQKAPGGPIAISKPLASVVVDLDDACLACKKARKNCGGQKPDTWAYQNEGNTS